MRKSFAVIGAILLFAMVAAAQDVPRMEAFLGYQYLRANSATNVPAFSANGGDGQFVYNFNKWLGAVAEVGAVHNGNIDNHQIDSTFANFLAGPRFQLRYSRITPYFQALFGGVYATSSTQILVAPVFPTNPIYLPGGGPITGNLANALSARVVTSQDDFAWEVGGGLDIKISKHMSFRPIELDYYQTQLKNLRSGTDNSQHNLKYMAGVNFTFGAQ